MQSYSAVDRFPGPRTVRISRILFVVYLAFLAYVLFGMNVRRETFGEFNVVPFKSIRMFFEYFFVYREFSFRYWFFNIFGNILLFIPFGFLLCPAAQDRLRLPIVLLCGLLLAFAGELIQYATHTGEMDIDDILLNMAGVFIGWALFRLVCFLVRRAGAKRAETGSVPEGSAVSEDSSAPEIPAAAEEPVAPEGSSAAEESAGPEDSSASEEPAAPESSSLPEGSSLPDDAGKNPDSNQSSQ